jgi:(p)ppGpp synthase/HD superfamily hydrolase
MSKAKDRTKLELLGIAIEIATQVHRGQTDKAGRPYILHPLFLMNQLMYDVELAIMAVMHDVKEDASKNAKKQPARAYELTHMATDAYLREVGFSERVITGLNLLTHKEGQTYDQYIEQIATNYDAVRVKRKDLDHNSRITRLKGIDKSDLHRTAKYHRAYTRLGEAKELFQEQFG